MNPVWFSKYRPKSFKDFVGQDIIRSEFQEIANGNAPMNHFLFHSVEAGTGKTTMSHLIADKLDYTLHIFNASSKKTRGIEFIEEDIIPLSQSGRWETIILLDEADRLTIQAQDALKGVIENATCYFILTCNDLSKVSSWLQSRCQLRHFAPISDESMLARMKNICIDEACEINTEDMSAIIRRHRGDLRNAIGCLQAYNTMPSEVKRNFILSLGDSNFDAKTFLKLCVKEQAFELAYEKITNMSLRQIIKDTLDYAINSSASKEAKMTVIESSIISERDILMGVDEVIVKWNYCRMLSL